MKRPYAHEIETLSKALLLDFFSIWVCNELLSDYGLDFAITIVENETISTNNFFVRLKGTNSIKILKDFVNYDLGTRYLKLYKENVIPIILILFDITSKQGYWIIMQEYIREILEPNKPNWENLQVVRIKIPIQNKLTDLEIIKKEVLKAFDKNAVNHIQKNNLLKKEEIVQMNLKEEEVEKIYKSAFHLIPKTYLSEWIQGLEQTKKGEFDNGLDSIYITEVCKELKTKIPGYQDKTLDVADYLEFLSQFPNHLRSSMAKLLRRIIFIGFEDMKNSLIELIEQIAPSNKNIYLILFEKNWQKSAQAWMYFTIKFSGRRLKCIKPSEFLKILGHLNKNQEYYFIFLDDIIITGNQFIQMFNNELGNNLEYLKEIIELKNKINLFLMAGIGTFNSLDYISKNTEIFSKSNIRYKRIINETDKAFHPSKWKDKQKLKQIIDFLKKSDPSWWNGYKDSQSLLVLEWNTPNNTIGCLWRRSNDWEPLFPRT